ncbi:MAG TPA: 4-aminobutyrate--2-oxoglutarate transaminase [Acidimicrobiales bacterium]|nr:4-aminobutyrate--2-oxoglutarate transaminase [Acidimicrobiales bacterium]
MTSAHAIEQRRSLMTQIPGPRSKELHDRRTHAVSSGLTVGLPVYIERAEGAILVDVDGNHLIDLGAGIAVTSVGHAVDEVVAAVSDQVARFAHTCFMVTPYDAYVEVCETLNRLTPGDHDKRSALFNSGAEAVENAVKIARRATGRQAVVVVEHAYHGRTNLTMALTAKNMPYKDRFGPFAPEVYRVPTSYPFRDGLDGPAAAARAIAAIETSVGAANVAALLIEPIQGEGGFVVPADGFLPALSAWCTDSGALLVADEIQTGFCRTGSWFACDHESVVPDLVATAKGIAAGLPLAGVTGRTELMDAVHEGGLGGTYGGNPVACAAALAAIGVMERDDLSAKARAIESFVRPRLEALQRACPRIGDVRGRGAMLAIEFVVPGTTTPDPAAVKAVVASCHAEGVVVITCGTYGNVVRLLPSLTIAEPLLDDGLSVLESAVRALD